MTLNEMIKEWEDAAVRLEDKAKKSGGEGRIVDSALHSGRAETFRRCAEELRTIIYG